MRGDPDRTRRERQRGRGAAAAEDDRRGGRRAGQALVGVDETREGARHDGDGEQDAGTLWYSVPWVGRIPSTSWLLVAGGVLLLLVGASALAPQRQGAHQRR